MAEHFPWECRHVLEALAVVYRNEAIARKRNLSPQSRLEFHQVASGPTMEELRAWLARQFDQRLVEPNSGLGGANPFDYLRRLERHAGELAAAPQHWMPWNHRATCDRILAASSTRASTWKPRPRNSRRQHARRSRMRPTSTSGTSIAISTTTTLPTRR